MDEQEAGSGVGNLEQEFLGSGIRRSVLFAAAENTDLEYEIHHDAVRGVANLSRFDAAFAAWQASQDAAYEAWQASQRPAFEAWQQRQYDRLLLYKQLGWKTKVLLVALRMGHLLKSLEEYERCKMMQLGVSWWREVCVFPPVFVNESSLTYLEVIQSDRLGDLQSATPLAKGLTTLRPIGLHVIDGKLWHVS